MYVLLSCGMQFVCSVQEIIQEEGWKRRHWM